MADFGVIGEIEEIKTTDEEKEIHWKIPTFLSLSVAYYYVCPDFKFLNVRWYLKLDPCEYKTKDYLALILKTDEIESVSDVLCTFGIKKADGSVTVISSFKHSLHPQVNNQNISLTVHKFFTRSELNQRNSELVPLGELTITCNLKLLSDSVSLAELNTLSENMKSLFTNAEYCDTTLQFENREFKAHKIILAARSPVFAAMFKHETSEKQTGIVNIPDCDPDSFQEFLEFLYCGKIGNISFRSALHLYKTADKYDVQELKKFCVVYMGHNLKVENVCDVVALADEYDETNLLAAAQTFFSRNLKEIFETAGWKELFKNNFCLANKLLIQMASKVKVVE